jgi:hypothetical protein
VLVLACAAGGCDLVFGVSDDAAPCGDESFAGAVSTAIVTAQAFSVSWAGDRIAYEDSGVLRDRPLPDGAPRSIDLTVYDALEIALTPEADAMFFTANIEPPVLQAFVRSGASWLLDGVVPSGAIAGSPSAVEFGPRRVLVRIRQDLPGVQEYEADGDHWRPVGDVHPVGGMQAAPNLTPSGLDMIYTELIGDAPGVVVAHRPSTGAWFGAPRVILPGSYESAQLLGRCRTLYALDVRPELGAGAIVRRYDR